MPKSALWPAMFLIRIRKLFCLQDTDPYYLYGSVSGPDPSINEQNNLEKKPWYIFDPGSRIRDEKIRIRNTKNGAFFFSISHMHGSHSLTSISGLTSTGSDFMGFARRRTGLETSDFPAFDFATSGFAASDTAASGFAASDTVASVSGEPCVRLIGSRSPES
jgi:hypothetical protein